MSDRSAIAWLSDAKSFAHEAHEIVLGLDQETFDRSRHEQLAVLYCLAVVGEALNQVPKDVKALAPEIPWAAINGLRNRIVHSYFLINNRIVLRIARDDIRPLAASIERLIERLG